MKRLFLLMILLPIIVMANPMMETADSVLQPSYKSASAQMKQSLKPDEVGFFLHDLNLTRSQNAKIVMLVEKERDLMEEDREKARKLRRDIQEMTLSDDFDEKKLEKLIDESLVIHKRYALSKARFSHDLYEVLTEEQRQALKLKMLSFHTPFPG